MCRSPCSDRAFYTALVALGYLNQIGSRFAQDYQRDRQERMAPHLVSFVPQIDLETRPWFNEGLESRWYFVPGVIGNLMMMMVMTLTAFAIVRERETGTLEQLMVTPVRRWEFNAWLSFASGPSRRHRPLRSRDQRITYDSLT